jgi:hypothetical protein
MAFVGVFVAGRLVSARLYRLGNYDREAIPA